MLELTDINYWAVLIVWLLYMGVGAYWYSPAGFAKAWKRHTGIDMMKIPTKDANRIIISVAVSALIQAMTLAIVFKSVGIETIIDGLLLGVLVWLGFVAATTVGVTLYSRRSWGFLWLNSAYFFIVMSVGSLILSVWQ